MKMQMLMMGVLLLAGTTFAQIPPNYDPFMYSKLGSSFCQGMVLGNYLGEIYDEGCAGQETQGNILQWEDDMWDEGEAMYNLFFTYVDGGNECCNGVCDPACLRQVRGQFMSYQRPVASLMSSGNALFLRAGRECVQEGMPRSEFLSMYRAYWAESLDCMRYGFDALPPEN